MKTTKMQTLTYWAKVAILATCLSFGIQYIFAWTSPSVSAPSDPGFSGPITTSATTQTKSGTLLLSTDLGVSRNATFGSYVTVSNTNGLCLSGVCHRTWPSNSSGVTSITAGSGITINNPTGNVTVSTNPTDVARAMFSSMTVHSCNLTTGSPKTCTISGAKNMCWLTNVFGRDGDDIDGFGCSVTGTPGSSNWSIRNVGEDYAQVFCEVKCI